jgi:AraC-like DNA-binding protein
VPRIRAISSDDLLAGGRPIVAARETPADRSGPRRAPVTHSYATLAFYTGGHARMEQNGEYNVREGEVALVPAGEPHRMLELRRAQYWGLAFRVPCFAADSLTLLAPLERVRDGASAIVAIPSRRHSFLESLFRELEELGRTPRGAANADEVVQRSLLTLILAEIDQAAIAGGWHREARSGVVVESLRFIERNCLRRLTPNDVAAAVGRSATYVTTALRKATGRSAGEWILAGRMAEARRLLLHSDERIDIIAERVGYADATHFIRMFRRTHGATPAAWRAAGALRGA